MGLDLAHNGDVHVLFDLSVKFPIIYHNMEVSR
jgi:hypothetical protein